MKRILICGLPGSGKTTLANRLVEILGNADLHNADEVRSKFKDWEKDMIDPVFMDLGMGKEYNKLNPDRWNNINQEKQ